MAKEIIVYYGLFDNLMVDDIPLAMPDAIANDPSISALARSSGAAVFRCPAIKDGMNNTFVYKSPYDYKLIITDKEIQSTDWDQAFFNAHINPRDVENRNLSIMFGSPAFYTAEDSLVLEQKIPFWHGSMLNDANYFLGAFDCAKHFRGLDFAVQFRKDTELNIKENDALYYIKFHTDSKVKLKRFFFTDEIRHYAHIFQEQRDCTRSVKPLSFWYDRAKKLGYKRSLLRLIKQNSE
jgi:hypothetical protein